MDEISTRERTQVQRLDSVAGREPATSQDHNTLVAVGISDALRDDLSSALHFSNYNILAITEIDDFYPAIQESPPRYVVIELPRDKTAGMLEVRDIRRAFAGTMIVLGDDVDYTDRVMSLEMGADNYLSRHISARALHAHLKASERLRMRVERSERLRDGFGDRSGSDEDLELLDRRRELSCDGWTLNMMISAIVAPDGRSRKLTEYERLVLAALMDASPYVVTRERLILKMAGNMYNPETRTLDVILCRIRAKLGDLGAVSPIRSVRGLGYQLVGFQRS